MVRNRLKVMLLARRFVLGKEGRKEKKKSQREIENDNDPNASFRSVIS